MSAFSTVPTLDLSLALSPETKPRLLKELRHAVVDVGILYVRNTGISLELIEQVKEQCVSFFDQPLEKKLEIELANVPSFLGYTPLGTEMTAGVVDWREHLSLSTQHPPRSQEEPLYRNLLGPNQWPDSASLPRFRGIYERYLADMSRLSTRFTALICEALGLDEGAFDKYFDDHQQHRLKVIKYPDLSGDRKQQEQQQQQQEQQKNQQQQALGAHKDSQVMTFILQASHHRCLQAQNCEGTWLDCPPVDGTFVVAIGQGLEAISHGVCAAATHRVLPPAPGDGDRYSLAFIKSVSLDLSLQAAEMPAELMQLRSDMMEKYPDRKDEVLKLYGDGKWADVGVQSLLHRIKSHPDVAQRWYPDIWNSLSSQPAMSSV